MKDGEIHAPYPIDAKIMSIDTEIRDVRPVAVEKAHRHKPFLDHPKGEPEDHNCWPSLVPLNGKLMNYQDSGAIKQDKKYEYSR